MTPAAAAEWCWDVDCASPFTQVQQNGRLALFSEDGSDGNAGVRGTVGFNSGVVSWTMLALQAGGTATEIGVCASDAQLDKRKVCRSSVLADTLGGDSATRVVQCYLCPSGAMLQLSWRFSWV